MNENFGTVCKMTKRIEIYKGNIVDFEGDAIVNAANNELILGSGVAGAIRQAGGPLIQEECNRHGPVEIGQAAITGAGNLKTKFVIHAASMGLGAYTTAKSLESSTMASLALAEKNGVETVALPAIGTGVAAFPVVRCAQIMLQVAGDFLNNSAQVKEIHFILFDDDSLEAFTKTYAEIKDN